MPLTVYMCIGENSCNRNYTVIVKTCYNQGYFNGIDFMNPAL